MCDFFRNLLVLTLAMLWDEYIEQCPEGYRYSRFCEVRQTGLARPVRRRSLACGSGHVRFEERDVETEPFNH
jgi:hypothetical protein